MNIFLHNINLDSLTEDSWRKLKGYALEYGTLFRGYSGFYRYVCMGNSEISFRMSPVAWEGNKAVDFVCAGYDANFRSSTFWYCKVAACHEEKNGDIYADVLPEKMQKGGNLSVRLIHADVLPSISPGDILCMQMVCFSKRAAYTTPLEIAAERNNSLSLCPLVGTIIPSPESVEGEDAEADGEKLVSFTAGIVAVRFQASRKMDLYGEDTVVSVTVETSCGRIVVVHRLEGLSERERALIQPGNIVRVQGWLSADVAVGEYQGGAIFDLTHDLRLLADCIRKRKHARARGIFSNDCRYYVRGKLRAEGPAAIVAALDAAGKYFEESGCEPDVVFGEMRLPANTGGADYGHGEKCLIVLTPEGKAHSVLFAKTDAQGKICRLSARDTFGAGVGIVCSDSYRKWCRGLTEPYDIGNRQSRSDNESEDFFAAEAAAGRLEGDRASFLGEPFFSFGDMWDIIAPDIEDVIAPDIDDCIARYLRLAKLYGEFGVAESGAEARYLDYPESGAPVRARMAVIDAGDGVQLETAYPVFAGYPARAHIVARYDWDNGVCGFLSLSVSEGSSLNFFVPSYGVSRRQCVPGSSVAVVISGLAVRFEKIRQAFFAAEHDSRREKFLEENPGKAVADFDVPVDRMELSVTAFPTGATCWYCIVAPVREVTEVQFDGRMFYQILLPIGRTASKEDVLAYIYAEKRANRDFDPVAGDLIQCLTWLCADPVPQGRGPKVAATKGDSSS